MSPGIAEPEDLLRLLTPEGQRLDDSPLAAGAADIGTAELQEMYRDLVLCRRFDDEATALQRQGELGLWASMRGQEAAQLGSVRALRPQDMIFPTYREHTVAYARGVPFEAILSLFRGVDYGGWRPEDHNLAPYTLVIAAQTLHATGYAMGVQRDGAVATGDPDRDTAVLVYFGDGASSEGDVSESLVFAASYQAPLVLLCQNNQWAISVPTSRQSRVPLYRRAAGFGLPGVRVDGNDVLAVLSVTREAAERARSGGGPTLIEAYTYRMSAHTTSDDTTRYRHSDEERRWAERDPILRVRRHLDGLGAADPQWLAEVDTAASDLGTDIRRRCRNLIDPDPETMFDHVYGDSHDPLDTERHRFRSYRDGTPDPDLLTLGGAS